MKKRILALFMTVVMIVLSLSACGEDGSGKSVTVGEKEYIRCYEYGYLYPPDDTVDPENETKVGRRSFYKVKDCEFDCLVAYRGLYPDVYFSSEDYDAAKAYYDDSESYSYYCLVGSQYGGRVYPADGIDTDKFEELYTQWAIREHDPLAGTAARFGFRYIPFDDESDFTAGELRFYKKSLDGVFCTYMGATFRIEDGKLVILRHYDLDNGGENTRMSVFDMPEELGEYFIEYVDELQND